MDENRKPIEMRVQSAERIRRQTSYREKKGESKDRKSIYITRTIRGIRRTNYNKLKEIAEQEFEDIVSSTKASLVKIT